MTYDNFLAKVFLGVIFILCIKIWTMGDKCTDVDLDAIEQAVMKRQDCITRRMILGMETDKCVQKRGMK